MPLAGTGTYIPSAGFSSPRSYLFHFATHQAWNLEARTDGSFIFNDFGTFNDRIYLNLRPSFWLWNSNHYNLEDLVVDAYFQALPDPTHVPYNFTLKFVSGTPARASHLLLTNANFSAPYQYFSLPSAPPSYWLP